MELRATLEYDFEQEKKFSYKGLNMDEIVHHLARSISRLWQIHVFCEGNTRTTAVFLIQYLRTLGFDVTNDTFAEHAWYFRSAMVRANYNNFQRGVHETTEYLELFLRNLLLGETNDLRNRYMHISNAFQKQDIDQAKQGIGQEKQDIDREKQDIAQGFPYSDILEQSGWQTRSIAHVEKLFNAYGYNAIFGRAEVSSLLDLTPSPSSTLLRKLLEVSVISPVSGMGKGRYRFIPQKNF